MSNPLITYFQDHPEVTIDALARAADIPYNTVSNLRNGRKKAPALSEAIRIAEATSGEVPITAWEG